MSTQVNILLHGLFFMRFNSQNKTLEVLVPAIPKHHFVGGERGSRQEITVPVVNPTNLTGKQTAPSTDDLPGSVLQVLFSDTNITGFSTDPSKFKSTIVLPWPEAFYSLRCEDIDKAFPFNPTSAVGRSIAANAKRKNSLRLGTVTLLRYTTTGTGPQNIHYYNQPCTVHKVPEVNQDLGIAAGCFLPGKSFDLQLDIKATITPVPRGTNKCNNPKLGTTGDDEMSLDEDQSPDILAICPLDERKNTSLNKQRMDFLSDPSVSPANCPTIFFS